jgi:hypothetical protein
MLFVVILLPHKVEKTTRVVLGGFFWWYYMYGTRREPEIQQNPEGSRF